MSSGWLNAPTCFLFFTGKGEVRTVAAAYLQDAKFLPATHAVLWGPAEIEEFFAGLFANGVAGHALRIIEVGGDGKLVYGAAN
jgi:ketosteroid isomerase-like protein